MVACPACVPQRGSLSVTQARLGFTQGGEERPAKWGQRGVRPAPDTAPAYIYGGFLTAGGRANTRGGDRGD
jgi:hypothetical protein